MLFRELGHGVRGADALALKELLEHVAGDLARAGAGAEAGVVAELARQLVIDARPAQDKQDIA